LDRALTLDVKNHFIFVKYKIFIERMVFFRKKLKKSREKYIF